MNNIVHNQKITLLAPFCFLRNQKGSVIYLTFWITSLLLGIALGVSSIFLIQIGILRGIGESVFAFSATDAGIEQVLFLDTTVCGEVEGTNDRVDCLKNAVPVGEVMLDNGATYQITVEAKGEGNCVGAVNYCVRSVGSYKSARRAVRIVR